MKVSYSSISIRLSKVDISFFEGVYELICEEFSNLYNEQEIRNSNLIRIDSTMVSEACNKLKSGFTVGETGRGKMHANRLNTPLPMMVLPQDSLRASLSPLT